MNGNGINKWLSAALVPMVCLVSIGYFSYHALRGQNGLIVWWQLNRQTEDLSARLVQARAERKDLQRHVNLLGQQADVAGQVVQVQIDPDMLDERVRHILNWSDPRELTILLR